MESFKNQRQAIQFLEGQLQFQKRALFFAGMLLIALSVFLYLRFNDKTVLMLGYMGFVMSVVIYGEPYRAALPKIIWDQGLDGPKRKLDHLFGAVGGVISLFWVAGLGLGVMFILFLSLDIGASMEEGYYCLIVGFMMMAFFAYPLIVMSRIRKEMAEFY